MGDAPVSVPGNVVLEMVNSFSRVEMQMERDTIMENTSARNYQNILNENHSVLSLSPPYLTQPTINQYH